MTVNDEKRQNCYHVIFSLLFYALQNVILSANVTNVDRIGTLLKMLLSQMNDEDAQKHLTQLFPRTKYAHFYADYWLDNHNQMNGNLTLHNLISALSKRENLFDISGTESMSVGFKVSTQKTNKNCKTFQISSKNMYFSKGVE